MGGGGGILRNLWTLEGSGNENFNIFFTLSPFFFNFLFLFLWGLSLSFFLSLSDLNSFPFPYFSSNFFSLSILHSIFFFCPLPCREAKLGTITSFSRSHPRFSSPSRGLAAVAHSHSQPFISSPQPKIL